MVYRKRTYTRKRTFNRKRTFKSKWARKQMIKPKFGGKVKQPVHYFTRFQDGGTITGLTGTTSTFGVVYWDLASLPGYGEFLSMYDFFKINAVQAKFIPTSNVSLGNNDTVARLTEYSNRFISILDYNDRNVPTSLNDLRQYSNCKVTGNNRIHKRFLHPKPLITMDEDSNVSNSYGIAQAARNPWISTQSNQCEYYGIKYGIEHPALNQNGDLYKVEFKVYLSFKGRN